VECDNGSAHPPGCICVSARDIGISWLKCLNELSQVLVWGEPKRTASLY